jgi:hypothetical protein
MQVYTSQLVNPRYGTTSKRRTGARNADQTLTTSRGAEAGHSVATRNGVGVSHAGAGVRSAASGHPFTAYHSVGFASNHVHSGIGNQWSARNGFAAAHHYGYGYGHHSGWGGWNHHGWGGWGWKNPYFFYPGFGYPFFGQGFGYGWQGLLGTFAYGLGYGVGNCYGGYGYGYPGYSYGYSGYGYGYPYSNSYSPYMTYFTNAIDVPNVIPTSTALVSTDPTAVGNNAPASVASFVDQGETAFRSGDFNGAVHAWRHAAVDDSQNPVLTMMLGQAFFATGKYDEAAGAIQMAMQQIPKEKWGVVVSNYKDLYGSAQSFTDQLRALEKAVRDKPQDPAQRFLLGFQYA